MFEKLQSIIVENLGCSEEEVSLESKLKDDLGADSLDAMEISMSIEEEFDISIADDAFEKFETVQDILDYIKAQE